MCVPELPANLVSRNEHKLGELRSVLSGWEIELLAADTLPDETGETYYDNARAKARFGRMLGEFDVWMLGEDSGLEVEGLDGGPGVRSARFAGEGEDAVEKLLRELEGRDGEARRARYVCELVGLSPELEEFRGTGILAGRVAPERRGERGFGYDPVFVPEGRSETVAELGEAWKTEHSHRAHAARALAAAVAGQS